MPDPHAYGVSIETKATENPIIEEVVLHAVAATATTVDDDLLEELLRIQAHGVRV